MGDSFPATLYQDLLFKEDTIVAVATPPGRGAIAAVRLSGPAAADLADQVFLPRNRKQRRLRPRRMTYGWLRDGEDLIDEAEVCFYPPPRTYTGESLVEFFVHGSPAVLRRLIETLVACGARPAEPGEFTLRAFRSGRLDLTCAEAVNELVRAENEITRRLALRTLRGGLRDALAEVAGELESILVNLETELEFESEATEADASRALGERLQPCIDALARLVEAGRRQQTHATGVVTAICGKPNVGKSSLLNRILGRERALVSAVPGTTRDTLEETVEIDGLPFHLVDTAGVFDATGEPDSLAVERSLEAVSEADLIVFLTDLDAGLDQRDFDLLAQVTRNRPPNTLLHAANKCDLFTPEGLPSRVSELERALSLDVLLPISAKVGTNVTHLLEQLATFVKTHDLLGEEASVLINLRQSSALRGVLLLLREADQAYRSRITIDLVVDYVHQALRLVRKIEGSDCDMDLLGAIFSRFCIGK